MKSKKTAVIVSLTTMFAVGVLFVCLCVDLRIFGQALIPGGGIDAGERLDDSTIRTVQCQVWRRDYKRLSLFAPQSPVPGETWGCAWIYVVDDNNVKFLSMVHSESGTIVIKLANNDNERTIQIDASHRNSMFYTDVTGNLREYVPSATDADIDGFLNQAIGHSETKLDYYQFWAMLQTKNAKSKIVFP